MIAYVYAKETVESRRRIVRLSGPEGWSIMGRLTQMWGVALALVACAGIGAGRSAYSQTPEKSGMSVFTDTFETDTNGWIAVGPHAKAAMTVDSKFVKAGKGALAFSFTVTDKAGEKKFENPGVPPVDILLRPIMDGQLTKMKALTFWARTDIAGGYSVSLQEKGEGRYMTLIWLPKDQWQRVTLVPEDFWLSDGKDDPKDADGKLDLDKVENVGVISVWSFLALALGDTPEGTAIITPAIGPHTLWLDDFAAATEVPPYDLPELALPAKAKGIWIDDMRRGVLGWLPIGNVELSLDKAAPFKTRALRVDYTQKQGGFVALMRDLHRFNLIHQERLSIDLASAKSAKLAITLEEKSGAKYVVLIDVPGDSVPIHRSIPFSDFNLAGDSPQDPDGQLDLDQIKTLSFTDITGSLGIGTQKNTLWLGPISAITLNL